MNRVVFYHITKCAGTTLLNILPDHAPYDKAVYIEQFSHMRISEDGPALPPVDVLSRMQVMHDPSCRLDWKAMLPNIYSVCFFRDPIDRLYSAWMMVRSLADVAVAESDEIRAGRDIARAGFHQYLISNNRRLFLSRWNAMTVSMLYGYPELFYRWIKMEALFNPDFVGEVMEATLKNVARLDFVGIVEDFETSIDLMALELGRPPFSKLQSHNVRGGGGYYPKIDADLLAAAESCVQLDRIIYARARDIFEAKLRKAQEAAGGSLRAAAEARYQRRLAEPPEWRLVSMGDVLDGAGWQQREVNGDKISRWIGPTPGASLDIVIAKDRDLFVRIRCTGFMAPAQLDDFRLRVDGVAVETTTWVYDGKFRYYDAVVPKHRFNSSKFLRLELDCGQVFRATDPGDPRMLGLEISDVEVGPTTGFRLGQPGTPGA